MLFSLRHGAAVTQARAHVVQATIVRELRMMKVFLQGTDVQVRMVKRGCSRVGRKLNVRPQGHAGRQHACCCATVYRPACVYAQLELDSWCCHLAGACLMIYNLEGVSGP